jgi:hypothetical protein
MGESDVKKIARVLLSERILNFYRDRIRVPIMLQQFKGLTNEQKFSLIYRKNLWGKSFNDKAQFCSGNGSHDPLITVPYVKAVREFIGTFDSPPSIVDLGCGDFAVGSQIVDLSSSYIACDIVPDLIARNKQMFEHNNLKFMQVDITAGNYPNAEIGFVRQVLQHLGNADIGRFVTNVKGKFDHLVVTEQLPLNRDFSPNLDKDSGPDIRFTNRSGVVLEEEPFKLEFVAKQVLCEVEFEGSRIVTTVFKMRR